jgi:hypothetical protein
MVRHYPIALGIYIITYYKSPDRKGKKVEAIMDKNIDA